MAELGFAAVCTIERNTVCMLFAPCGYNILIALLSPSDFLYIPRLLILLRAGIRSMPSCPFGPLTSIAKFASIGRCFFWVSHPSDHGDTISSSLRCLDIAWTLVAGWIEANDAGARPFLDGVNGRTGFR